MEREWLTTRQVADRAQVTVKTVNQWVNEGRLTPVFVVPGEKGARFYSYEAVADLLAARQTGDSDE